jgi:monoamine oxidase
MPSRMAYSPATRLFRRLAAEQDGEQRSDRGAPDLAEHSISRRDFLRGAGAAAAGLAAASALGPLNVRAARARDARVVVIGAGAAGLRCAHSLRQAGITAQVYEAAGRIGGRTFSATDFFADGQVAEHGGEFISTEHNATRNLARNLGLRLEVVDGGELPGGEEIYHIDGAFYTYSEASADWLIASKAFKDELQAAPFPQNFDSFTQRGRELDLISVPAWFDPANPHSNPILAGFGPSSRFAKLMQANVISEYGGNPEVQPALNLLYLLAWNSRNNLSPLPGTDEIYHVQGGNEQIAQRMAAQLVSGSVHTGRALTAITGEAGGPYTCQFATGAPVVADHLVLALPFRTLREVAIDSRIWAAFRPEKRFAITSMPIGTNAKLQVQGNTRPWSKVITANGQQIQANGVAYSDPAGFQVVWDGSVASPSPRGILVDYLGGTKGTQLRGQGAFGPASAQDVSAFLAAIEPVFPGTTAAYSGRALKSSWIDDPWHKGAYSYWGIGHYTGFSGAEGLQEGAIHFAGEHTSVDFQGYIEGAVRSGERVAQEIAQQT